MAKQHVRNGRDGKIARQDRANDPNKERLQWWDGRLRQWIREG
jgi:hypothetical protein